MSGSAGFGYQIVSAEELRRRAIEAAMARVNARLTAVTILRAEVGKTAAARVSATRISRLETADVERLNDLDNTLAAEERALVAAAESVRSERAKQALEREIDALQVALPTMRFRGTAREAPRPTAKSGTGEQLAHRVDAVLELAVRLDASFQADIRKLAGVVTDGRSSSARALGFLTEMEARVTQGLKRQQIAQRRAERTRELTYEYAVLLASDTAQGEQAQALIAQLPDGDLDGAVRALRDLELRRTRQADQRFAVDQATAVLREMGYGVDVEPSTGATVAMVSGADWPHHGLKVVFPADAEGVHTIPVAFENTDARDDAAFDKSTCDAIDQLRDGLSDRGVPTTLTYQRPPGELPVQRHARRRMVTSTRPAVRRKQL
ncbi:hypothetical protein AB0E69_06565 [Kribbella sp. NPDC026611]|uniref:hypothetical protein n=1 Tax=Kribbella sp. NPDC026611 TaxID=3154911 RepID=UPI0033F6A154